MLRIKVGRCPDKLPKSDAIGGTDPYVRFAFEGGEAVCTEHIPNDHTQPEWNQDIEVPLPGDGFSAAPLTIQILDYDKKGDDDLLAEGRVDLRSHIAAWASAEGMEGAEVRPA